MTKEQYLKAGVLIKNIELIESNIKLSQWLNCEDVVIRPTYLRVNGLEKEIVIPESLFRVIGKLILQEQKILLDEYKANLEQI
jgi:hypothetical protein